MFLNRGTGQKLTYEEAMQEFHSLHENGDAIPDLRDGIVQFFDVYDIIITNVKDKERK